MPRFRLLLVTLAWLLACLASACSLPSARAGATCDSAAVAIFAAPGSPSLALEVARTAQERATGLMNRASLPADSGMLFVFDGPTTARFWMKDTLIPLSIAFITGDGTILDIQDMQPETLDAHGPAAPYVYAIEANQGWFAAHGVQPGQTVNLCFGGA